MSSLLLVQMLIKRREIYAASITEQLHPCLC